MLAVMTGAVVNINDVLDGHVGLEIECVDRLYLNAYVQLTRSTVPWTASQIGPHDRTSRRCQPRTLNDSPWFWLRVLLAVSAATQRH